MANDDLLTLSPSQQTNPISKPNNIALPMTSTNHLEKMHTPNSQNLLSPSLPMNQWSQRAQQHILVNLPMQSLMTPLLNSRSYARISKATMPIRSPPKPPDYQNQCLEWKTLQQLNGNSQRISGYLINDQLPTTKTKKLPKCNSATAMYTSGKQKTLKSSHGTGIPA